MGRENSLLFLFCRGLNSPNADWAADVTVGALCDYEQSISKDSLVRRVERIA
jgi:hypothetical protein